MTQDRHAVPAFLLLFRQEPPTQLRRDSQQGEQVGRGGRRFDLAGLRQTGHVTGAILPGGQGFKYLVLFAPLPEVPRGGPHLLDSLLLLLFPESHDAIGVFVWQGPQQNGVDHAENRAIRADAQRQREHRHRGETGVLSQHSHAIPDVLPQRSHFSLLFISQRLHRIDLGDSTGRQINGQECHYANQADGNNVHGRIVCFYLE